MGDAPFHTVYLHGTARDTQHRKMSKSLGNGIDPLVVVEKYGADALRWTIVSGLGMGADAIFDPQDLEKTFAPGRNFATKLWNIARFLLSQLGDEDVRALPEISESELTSADRWVLQRLDVAIAECDAALGPARPVDGSAGHWSDAERRAGLRLNEYAESARRFVWNELADWYVEAVKPRLQGSGPDRDVARAVLVHAFDEALRLLHPIVPFITETLWQRLPGRAEGEFLARAGWPRVRGTDYAPLAFDAVRDAVIAIRQLRADFMIPPGKTVTVHLTAPAAATSGNSIVAASGSHMLDTLRAQAPTTGSLARATLVFDAVPDGAPSARAAVEGGATVAMLLDGAVDVEREKAKYEKELAELEKQLGGLEKRLSNPSFLAKARPDVVEAEHLKLDQWKKKREHLIALIQSLGGA
jgi:valyl-tRNA synthetase